MGINVFPIASTGATSNTGWTAGVAGTFTLSNSLAAGTYLIKTDTTQTMTISLQDATGHTFSGTIRGGSGFISVPVTVTKIVIPGSLTYPFGIEIVPISVTQVAAPTSGALSLGTGGVMTGTWNTAPADAVSAHLLTTTGDILNFSSTTSGATVTVTASNTTPNALNNFIIAFKNSSGAWGIGATVPYTMPAAPYPFYVDYLVVGAGGSAGNTTGRSGGGGGAVKTATNIANTAIGSSFTVSVAPTPTAGNAGGSSTFSYGSTTITATGGAAGATANNNGNSGSSGSGGYSSGNTTVYSGGTGNDGGNGGASVSPNTTYESTGAGGGAGGSASGWNSGNGIGSSITGTLTYYAGGGAGGQYSNSGSVGLGGTARNSSGAANSGAGSGAGGNFGGTGDKLGGSGVVIYAYPSAAPALTTIPGTLTYTVDTTTRAGYRVYKFTAGNGTVTI
jgi:hypothetical protein